MTSIQHLENSARYYAESGEPWKCLHAEADACHIVEKQLVFGVYLFDGLDAAETAWRAGVAAGEIEHDQSVADAIENAWRLWMLPRTDAKLAIQHFESIGYAIEAARDFGDRCNRAERRIDRGPRTNAWTQAVKSPNGKLFGKRALTETDLAEKKNSIPQLGGDELR